MEIAGYKKEYLEVLHSNFPFVDYVSKYTDLSRQRSEWTGVCPLCEFSTIILKPSSWHCKTCTSTPDGSEPIFYSSEAFLAKFHRLDIFDAVCFMEGWVSTHTDAELPPERYVYFKTSVNGESDHGEAEPLNITESPPGETREPAEKQLDLEALLETSLPPSPHNLMRIFHLSRDFNSPVREIVKAISFEPLLVTRILRLANSPIYGLERQITSIQTAITTVGSKSLQEIVMVALASATFAKQINGSAIARKIWEHSLAVGIFARELSEMLRIKGAEEIFTCGLLHDIGKLMFLSYDPDEFSKISIEADEDFALSEEQRLYGHDHAEIGALVARRWSLQEDLCSAIKDHHDPFQSDHPMMVTHILEIADIVANNKGYGTRYEDELKLANSKSLQILRLTQEELDNAWEKIEKSIGEVIRTFH